MNEQLHNKRHTLAHLLAQAVLEVYPDAQPTIGPAIDNGFYYDFDNLKISDKDLSNLQKRMRKSLSKWSEWERQEVTAEEARAHFAENPYKLELIDEINAAGESITLYTCGGFTDLCRGGHSKNPSSDIDGKAFTLDRVAGAYWRGDENNAMLTRIYGLAFDTSEELAEYQEQLKLAKERDHRKLGKELDLFVFSEKVGPGLPLWTPNGTLLRTLLDDYVWELRKARGYHKVEIPHITKKDLFETSGHWEKFADELFKTKSREGHEFALKPMNCPFHTQIFDRKKHSYREMPQRYANTTMCYRDEQSGELHGLSRVRAFTQDDAHVFCRKSQIKEEALKIWDIIETFYGSFGFDMKVRLSMHDPENMEKYLGDITEWDEAVSEMRSWIEERGVEYFEGVGEAAFYGPKIDFIALDSIGREWQVATLQVDSQMPKNFELTCVNEDGENEQVFMLHAAIMGSLERFMSTLIEHLGGVFPLWLAPTQVHITPIADAHNPYASQVAKALQSAGMRVHFDDSKTGFGKKIRNWKVSKSPYAIVIGDDEVANNTITLEHRNGSKKTLSVDQLLTKLSQEVSERALD